MSSIDPESSGSGQWTDDRDARAALSVAATTLGLELTDATTRQLVAYLDLLARWTRVYNLTSIRDRSSMRVQHLNDSLAIVASLRRFCRRVASNAAPSVLDVGSGGGLPGVVVALCWPEAQVTCVDAVGKKTAFLSQVAGSLGVQNLKVIHGRIEAVQSDRRFDVVTARAFSSLADTVTVTRSLLAPDGVWMLAKGHQPLSEIAALRPLNVDVFHVERLAVPELEAERHLVWIRLNAR